MTDPTLGGAILHALREAGWLVPMTPARPRPTYKPTLPGVYANLSGLRAYFFRRVDGRTKNIHVATGKVGLFTLEEEERLHGLWVAATAAWDAENRPAKPAQQGQDARE